MKETSDDNAIDNAVDLMLKRLETNPAILRAKIDVASYAESVSRGLKEAGRVLTERDPDFPKKTPAEIAAAIIEEKNNPAEQTPESSREIYEEAHDGLRKMAASASFLAKKLGGGEKGINNTLMDASVPALTKTLDEVMGGVTVTASQKPANTAMMAEASFALLEDAVELPEGMDEELPAASKKAQETSVPSRTGKRLT